ncbi:MAG: ribonuclease R [Clostridia bacterium]|nr:ribonuclease R [Clostridia bacterium]
MDKKEKIISYINSKEYIPLTFDELCIVLDVPKEDNKIFLAILNELENEEQITITKKGRYIPLKKDAGKVIGTLKCNERGFFAFLIPEEEGIDDVYIYGSKLNAALDSDRVLVQIDNVNSAGGRKEGHVLKVLERRNKSLTGIVEKEKDGIFRIKCDRERIYTKLRVKSEDMLGAKIGDRVLVELTKYTDDGHVYGIITKVLGDADALSGYIEAIVLEHGINQEFSEEVLRETENISDLINEKEIEGRRDLRNKIIFTIDGENARDFDDAVSIEKQENGNYLLGVHIADVTHYVREGSALDKSAFDRGTSVYLADRVIPMLPKKLSNGICSLNPHVDRLTLSVFMEIDENGGVLRHTLEKSVIRSVERMTYTDVTKLLEGTDERLLKKYQYILSDLKIMEDLAAILRKRRMERGSIDFDFPESEVIVNEVGEPVEIAKVEREVSHKLIEEFMLVANETIAEYAFWSDLPFVYRVHEAPDSEKIKEFNDFVSNFGVRIKGRIDDDNPIHPKALQQVLEKIRGMPEELMISTYLLRSLMKAKYSPNSLGHFGLAAKYYTHFTSPIRRYPDLAIHRILKEFIDGKLNDERIEELKAFAAEASFVSTEREAAADYCERDVEDLMKAAYMSQFVGENFSGVVSSVTAFGMFVELENTVEGLIRVDLMMSDYFIYDEEEKQLVGEKTKKVYKVGDRVNVTLIRTDLMSRQIDFMLAEDATEKNIKRAYKREKEKSIEKQAEIKNMEKKKAKRAQNLRNGVKKSNKRRKH